MRDINAVITPISAHHNELVGFVTSKSEGYVMGLH